MFFKHDKPFLEFSLHPPNPQMAVHLKTHPGIQNSIPQPTVHNPLKAQKRKKICENMQITDGDNLCLLKKGKQKV